jgi:preprotein translocase subunit SecA
LRGYGQRDPLVEYKQEAYRLFENLLKNIESNVVRTIFKVEVEGQPQIAMQENVEYIQPDIDELGGFEHEKEDLAVTQKMMSVADEHKYKEDGVKTKILNKGKTVYDRMKESSATGSSSQVKNSSKVGRNDPCPCGSGKKYKKCCGK